MAFDRSSLLDPSRSALLVCEMQNGIVGATASLPGLARSAQAILPAIVALVDAAHELRVPVFHCMYVRRPDGGAANRNAPLFGYMSKVKPDLAPGSRGAAMLPDIDVRESDYVLTRLHGLAPFHGTELDFLLRNLRAETVVVVGVSVNIAVTNLSFDAVNAGYSVVIPPDAVASDPPEYKDLALKYSLGNVAALVSSADIVSGWRSRGRG